jgi:serine/threonine protein kinase
MPAPPDPATTGQPAPRFRDTAIASGLLSADTLAPHEAEIGRTLGTPAAAGATAWDAALADRLVAEGVLTRFQAQQLLAGRRKLTLGQYTIVDEIGHGGMGQVFRAEHSLMGRTVAIKVLPRAKANEETEAAFRREIRMLARLDHENLVRALDAGHDGKVYYLVTELVPGLDLRRQVLKHGPLDGAAAASVIAQAARGLAYAHGQGLVHRDVKPSNLLVTPEGRVKLLDLGLAGSSIEAESARLGRVVGTMDYMAPEQIRSPDTVGPAADVYALGCTLYFAVTGQVPFPGGSRQEKANRQLAAEPRPMRELAPAVDEPLCAVVAAMMKKDPRERVPSAGGVIEKLARWIPAEPVPMPRTKRQRSPSARAVAAAATAGPPADGAESATVEFSSAEGGQRTPDLLSEAAETRADSQQSLGARNLLLPSAEDGGSAAAAAGTAVALPSPAERVAALVTRARTAILRVTIAAVAGFGFAGLMFVLSRIHPRSAEELLGEGGFTMLGTVIFTLVLLGQIALAPPPPGESGEKSPPPP